MQVSRAATLDTASNATAITVSHLVDKREQSFGTWLSCREKFIGLSGRVFGIRVGQAPHKRRSRFAGWANTTSDNE